jgi:hypothetical protein
VQAPATKTLGDILYADKSKIRVSEDEWLKLIQAMAGGSRAHCILCTSKRIESSLR